MTFGHSCFSSGRLDIWTSCVSGALGLLALDAFFFFLFPRAPLMHPSRAMCVRVFYFVFLRPCVSDALVLLALGGFLFVCFHVLCAS